MMNENFENKPEPSDVATDVELAEALELLDDDDNAHWNVNNLPNINYLKDLLNRKQITRAQVEQASARMRIVPEQPEKISDFSSPDSPDDDANDGKSSGDFLCKCNLHFDGEVYEPESVVDLSGMEKGTVAHLLETGMVVPK